MSFKKITKEGVIFLEYVAKNNGYDGLIKGKNKYEIPFTYDVEIPNILTANIYHNNKLITNNSEYVKYLIEIYNMYGEIYDMDSNILLAQAYAESGLKVWNYAAYNSTATGLTQFLISTIYEVIIKNNYNINPKFSIDEINKITNNIIDPYNNTSYAVGDTQILSNSDPNFKTRSKSRKNRYNLLINCMNNPDLLIKAQFRYMKYISERNNKIASNTLFAYNRGSGYKAETYIDLVNYVKRVKGVDYIQEGVKYVERIFGLLGDKNNIYIKNKPKGYYFGYTLDLNKDQFDSYSIFTK